MKAKLLIFTLLAVVVFPATASATNTPELTYPTGSKLAVESKLKAVNIGELKFTGSNGTVSCTSASLTGTLTKNTGSELEATLNGFSLTGTGGDGRCTGASSQTWVSFSSGCLRSTPEMIEDEFQIRGESCAKSGSALTATFGTPTVALECVYERTTPIAGTFATHPEDAVLSVAAAEFPKKSGGISCFSALRLDSSFTFERTAAGTNPLYISGGPIATFPTGTKLGTETAIRAKTTGAIKLTGAAGESLLECSSGETAGTLKKNSGTEIEANIESAFFTGTGTEGTCTSPFGNTEWTLNSATNGLPWCLRATSAMAANEFQIRGNNCAGVSRPIRIVVETTAVTNCSYERKAAITGTYTTHPEDADLHLGNAILLETEPRKAACADETTMDASFTLERDEAGTHPVYVS